MRTLTITKALLVAILLGLSTAPIENRQSKTTNPLLDSHGDPLPPGVLFRLGTQRLHHGAIESIAWSPDGKWVASAAGLGFVNSARVWDAATGKLVSQCQHQAGGRTVAFSPDGKSAVSVDQRGALLVWEPATGNIMYGRLVAPGAPILFDATGKNFATIDQRGQACLIETETLLIVKVIAKAEGRLARLAWSESAKMLAWIDVQINGQDQKVQLIDAVTGTVQHTLEHAGPASCLTFSPDGKILATAGDGGVIYFWDATNGQKLRHLEGHLDAVKALAWAPDGKTLASGGADRTVRLWDIQKGQEVLRYPRPRAPVTSVAFSPDGKRLASGGGGADTTLHIWEAATGKDVVTFDEHYGWLGGIALLEGGKTVLTSATDEVLRLWDVHSGINIGQLTVPHTRAKCIAVTPDGKLLAAGAGAGIIRLLAMPKGTLVKQLQGNNKTGIYSVGISADAKWLASSGGDNRTWIWNVAEGRAVHELKHEDDEKMFSFAFSPDGKVLCSGGGQGSLRLWDVATGQELARLPGHTTAIERVLFSPNGKLLASASYDNKTPLVWDVASRKVIRRFTEFDPASSLAFSPDGRMLAAGGVDHVVRLWELATGQQRATFAGHHGLVAALAFHPDGKTLISGGADSTALCWDLTGAGRGKGQPPPLDGEELDAQWNVLQGDNAAEAYKALLTLASNPEQALTKLKKELQPAQAFDTKAIAGWIADLDSSSFEVREIAKAQLIKAGDAAWPALRRVLENPPSLEAKERARQLLGNTADPLLPLPDRLPRMRALELLEALGTPGARAFAQDLANGEPDSWFTEEAKALLQRMVER
jgi:WD40 repeat protein